MRHCGYYFDRFKRILLNSHRLLLQMLSRHGVTEAGLLVANPLLANIVNEKVHIVAQTAWLFRPNFELVDN